MPITITTDEELGVLLGTLGTTADAIADRLRADGITGRVGNTGCCPVANWLKRETGCEDVTAGLTRVFVGGYLAPEVETPEPISVFMEWFDDGVYPDLVEEPQR